MDTVAVLDFGGQTSQLISRRIREGGVYSEVLPGEASIPERLRAGLKGVVLSGSPASAPDPEAPRPHSSVFELGVPVLGICYGLQRIVHDGGGEVWRAAQREYGRTRVRIREPHPLFAEVPDGFLAWMSHGDTLSTLPAGYRLLATSEHGAPAAVSGEGDRILGLQFHPEVSHCEYGSRILSNFAERICGARADWSMDRYLEDRIQAVRDQAGDESVLLLISGGVDSTVVGALLLQALPPEQVHLMYVDTGLMRAGETEQVTEALEQFGAENLYIVDARERFLGALSGVRDPEEKRRIIGDLFMTVQQDELERRGIAEGVLAQGTLYTDMIESGGGVGDKAKVIKSHHNVRSPIVARKRDEGRLIEPLRWLYKDEVRVLGRVLGLPESVVDRHPFPGPGLAVRIVGEITPEAVETLQEADRIYVSELRKRGLYEQIWQAFAVLLPVRSVGVTGDSRHYGAVVALRAVTSTDGMTADVFRFPPDDLMEISARITNEIPAVGRVVYDVSSKPPSTIEWE